MTDDPQSKLEKALDSAAAAPPEPGTGATSGKGAKASEAKEGDKLEIGLKESFPSSDPPSVTQPGHNEPAPSSGYDEAKEKSRERVH